MEPAYRRQTGKSSLPENKGSAAFLQHTKALVELMEQRIQALGETLRQEFVKIHAQHRQEMILKIRLQWALTAALLVQTIGHEIYKFI